MTRETIKKYRYNLQKLFCIASKYITDNSLKEELSNTVIDVVNMLDNSYEEEKEEQERKADYMEREILMPAEEIFQMIRENRKLCNRALDLLGQYQKDIKYHINKP